MDVSTSKNPIAAGDTLMYTITVTNDSSQQQNDVKVSYRVPAGISFNTTNDAEPNGVCGDCGADDEATWSNLGVGGSLAAGESRSITINATVSATTLPQGSLISAPIRVTATGLADTIVLTNTVAVQ